jgi:hypothetical protein
LFKILAEDICPDFGIATNAVDPFLRDGVVAAKDTALINTPVGASVNQPAGRFAHRRNRDAGKDTKIK